MPILPPKAMVSEMGANERKIVFEQGFWAREAPFRTRHCQEDSYWSVLGWLAYLGFLRPYALPSCCHQRLSDHKSLHWLFPASGFLTFPGQPNTKEEKIAGLLHHRCSWALATKGWRCNCFHRHVPAIPVFTNVPAAYYPRSDAESVDRFRKLLYRNQRVDVFADLPTYYAPAIFSFLDAFSGKERHVNHTVFSGFSHSWKYPMAHLLSAWLSL